MRKTLSIIAVTLLILGLMDLMVFSVLDWADHRNRLGSLVRYFEYGRSVPGKLARWEARPDLQGNLYDVSWRAEGLKESAAEFAAELPGRGPVVRSYGMSFVNNILGAAQEQAPLLDVDSLAGPGAPPNYTYAQFLDDRTNRRAGDIVVLGILSSSVASMASLSNQTRVFEQPAPFTYPIFYPEGEGDLRRVEPLIASSAAHRSLADDPARAHAWHRQLATEDAFYSWITFDAPWLDRSPFARLVRRSLAAGHIQRTERLILAGDRYPYAEVLSRMIANFAAVARADGQFPVVMLIQSRKAGDPDLLKIARPILIRDSVPYLATAEHVDPRNPSAFQPDGHYKREIDQLFGRKFLDLVSSWTGAAG